jgi:hypothetical protein
VRRNSANFAPARCRKSFADWQLAHGGEAKLSEFRLGGVTKFSPGEALFVRPALWCLGATGFASATPFIREFEAIVSNKHQLVLELKMLERRTEATIRKALASKHWQSQWHSAQNSPHVFLRI